MDFLDAVVLMSIFSPSKSSSSPSTSNKPEPKPPKDDGSVIGVFLLLAVLFAPLMWYACNGEAPPTIPSIIINNTASNNQSSAPTGPTTPTGCDPVVRVDIKAPTTLIVGATGDLDATPKSATGARPTSCDLASGVQWAATPTGVCSLTGPVTSFTPNIHGDGTGQCTVTAVVAGVGGIAVIQVQ